MGYNCPLKEAIHPTKLMGA